MRRGQRMGKKLFTTIILILFLSLMSLSYGEEIKYSLLEPYFKVMAADNEYIWAAGDGQGDQFMKLLYKSSDYGNSWELVHTFEKTIEGIHITEKGCIFVSISDDRWSDKANGEIWRSTNGGISFIKVLDLKTGTATNWNMASDDEGYIFISEYGYKGEERNARRIYRSKDNGLNWYIVYEPEEISGYHNHIIFIDKQDKNIIYQVIGDETKLILRSEDRGDTWSPIIEGYHPTSILQIGNEILFGLDNYPYSGIIKYNKEVHKFENCFETPEPFDGSIYDMIYVNDIIYAGFLSYDDNEWDGSIFISRDKGQNWENFFTWSKEEDIGVGFYTFSAQDDYIFVWVTLPIEKDGIFEKYQGTLRFEAI